MLRDIAHEVSYSVIGVQTLLEYDANENRSSRSKRKPHEWMDMLLQPFFCAPMCHGETHPSVPAGCKMCCATAGNLPASTASEIQSNLSTGPTPPTHNIAPKIPSQTLVPLAQCTKSGPLRGEGEKGVERWTIRLNEI